jgi:hypothetical protein
MREASVTSYRSNRQFLRCWPPCARTGRGRPAGEVLPWGPCEPAKPLASAPVPNALVEPRAGLGGLDQAVLVLPVELGQNFTPRVRALRCTTSTCHCRPDVSRRVNLCGMPRTLWTSSRAPPFEMSRMRQGRDEASSRTMAAFHRTIVLGSRRFSIPPCTLASRLPKLAIVLTRAVRDIPSVFVRLTKNAYL